MRAHVLLMLGALAAASPAAAFSAAAQAARPMTPRPLTPVVPAASDTGARVTQISARAGAHQRVTLRVDKAEIIQLDTDARDVLVSNPDIVDAVVRTPRRIFLLAQKTGQTNAFFFDGAGRQILSLDIRVEKDVADVSGMIQAMLPGSDVKVTALNDNVVLSGSVASAQDSARVQDVAARFTGDPAKVVNLISVKGGEQVMLKVRIAEMNRTVAKQFGVDMAGAMTAGGVPMIASTSNPYGLMGKAISDLSGLTAGEICTPTGTGCTGGRNNMQGTLKALEQIGLVHTLAEPTLISVSGETGKFLAGGEFPIPVSRDRDGNITVEYKQFGVGLSFTPVVLGPGRISLQLSTEVSELTNTGSFTLGGGASGSAGALTLPALSVRRAETTIELPSGGSFAVAGLMQHASKQVLEGFPGLKDMPVLGALFRSRDFQNNESELVVLVTAYLAAPVAPEQLSAPTDGFVTPADAETLLLGRLNTVYKRDAVKPNPAPGAARAASYILQ